MNPFSGYPLHDVPP